MEKKFIQLISKLFLIFQKKISNCHSILLFSPLHLSYLPVNKLIIVRIEGPQISEMVFSLWLSLCSSWVSHSSVRFFTFFSGVFACEDNFFWAKTKKNAKIFSAGLPLTWNQGHMTKQRQSCTKYFCIFLRLCMKKVIFARFSSSSPEKSYLRTQKPPRKTWKTLYNHDWTMIDWTDSTRTQTEPEVFDTLQISACNFNFVHRIFHVYGIYGSKSNRLL